MHWTDPIHCLRMKSETMQILSSLWPKSILNKIDLKSLQIVSFLLLLKNIALQSDKPYKCRIRIVGFELKTNLDKHRTERGKNKVNSTKWIFTVYQHSCVKKQICIEIVNFEHKVNFGQKPKKCKYHRLNRAYSNMTSLIKHFP